MTNSGGRGESAGVGYARVMKRAVSLLKRREHSVAELRAKLESRAGLKSETGLEGDAGLDSGAGADVVNSVLAELQKRGLLSDERFTAAFVREKQGQLGKARIAEELTRLGVSGDIAQSAMQQLHGDEESRALSALNKKHPPPSASPAKAASLARFLLSRGFDPDTTEKALRTKFGKDATGDF